jgi:hypothetical protein
MAMTLLPNVPLACALAHPNDPNALLSFLYCKHFTRTRPSPANPSMISCVLPRQRRFVFIQLWSPQPPPAQSSHWTTPHYTTTELFTGTNSRIGTTPTTFAYKSFSFIPDGPVYSITTSSPVHVNSWHCAPMSFGHPIKCTTGTSAAVLSSRDFGQITVS